MPGDRVDVGTENEGMLASFELSLPEIAFENRYDTGIITTLHKGPNGRPQIGSASNWLPLPIPQGGRCCRLCCPRRASSAAERPRAACTLRWTGSKGASTAPSSGGRNGDAAHHSLLCGVPGPMLIFIVVHCSLVHFLSSMTIWKQALSIVILAFPLVFPFSLSVLLCSPREELASAKRF